MPTQADTSLRHSAVREHYEEMAAAAAYPRLLALLVEARAALSEEYCGTANSLAGRIDDVLHPSASVSDSPLVPDELVLESYGAGHAWLRPESDRRYVLTSQGRRAVREASPFGMES